MADTTEPAWTLDHHLYVLARTESRPTTPNTEGDTWRECRHTGMVTVVCACGYTSGLVDPTTLPSVDTLTAAHPSTAGPFTRLGPTP
ncbi:hypothetical protein ACWHA6_37850 [Streptomyces anthocyanicus]|uniref:hypothetical protein n=1 Tax=Streptomyces TaxID=1883 RepID=UPI00365AF0C7